MNCAFTSCTKDNEWLIDSTASHKVNGNLTNLCTYSECDGTCEVAIGNESSLLVFYDGSLVFQTSICTFHLDQTLCAPKISKKLIFVHHFTSQNNVFIEFHPTYFPVKDQFTRTIMLRGICENSLYTLPKSLVDSSK